MKPIVILQNAADDPPDTLADFLAETGLAFEVRRVWEGDPLPERPSDCAALVTLGASIHAAPDRRASFARRRAAADP